MSSTDISAAEAGIGRPPSPNLGRSVGHGMSWMVGVTLATRALAFAAQVILGWLLSADDFGVYALAIAAAGVVAVFRDGGAKELLIQRGAREYPAIAGPLFWMAATINTVAAALLVGAAPLVARVYGDPRLTWMIIVIAASLPLSTPGAILQTKLRMDLRFGDVARIAIGSALVRTSLTVAFAAVGVGPLSFVLPLLAVTLYENAASYRRVRDPLWRREARPGLWWGYLRRTAWLMAGSLANLMVDWGNYLAVGLFVSLATVGLFSFAFNLVVQLAMLLSSNAQVVLTPVLARLNGEPQRQREAIARALRALMLLAAPACLGFAAIAEPLERVLWQGRWAGAVPAVQALGVFYPMRITFGLTIAALQAQGRFKRWAILTAGEGLAMIAAGALAAAWWGTPGAMALAVGAAMALARFAVTWYTLALWGVAPARRLGALLPAWGLAVLAWGPVYAADVALGRWGAWSGLAALCGGGLHPRTALVASQGLRLLAIGTAFSLCFGLLSLLLIPRYIQEALDAAPARVAAPLRRMLGYASRRRPRA